MSSRSEFGLSFTANLAVFGNAPASRYEARSLVESIVAVSVTVIVVPANALASSNPRI